MIPSLQRFKWIYSFVLATVLSFPMDLVTPPMLADEPAVEESTKTKDSGFSSAWQVIHGVADKLMAQHVSPPTRQQMYLAACRGIFIANKELPPSDLSATFSKLTTEKQFREKVNEFWNSGNNKNIPPEQLVRVCVAAMLFDCEPGSAFISENQNRINKQLADNQYVGIGIKVGQKDGYPQIIEPYFGGAAQKAGARQGDLIVAVDGEPTKGRKFRDVIEQLRGAKDTSLTVTLRHESEDTQREYSMVRNVIPIDTVTGHERNEHDGNWNLTLPGLPEIAYLKINSIVGSTAAELSQQARRIEKGNFNGVILDFTGNPRAMATDIHHAVMLADVLVGETKLGDVVTPKNKTEIRTQSDHVFKNTGLVVLAPAIVSGPELLLFSALANNDRVKIVGPQILSDGRCRKSIDLENMGAIQRISYAVAYPDESESLEAQASNHQNDDPSATGPRFILEPDVVLAASSSTAQYVKAAVKILNQQK